MVAAPVSSDRVATDAGVFACDGVCVLPGAVDFLFFFFFVFFGFCVPFSVEAVDVLDDTVVLDDVLDDVRVNDDACSP